MYKELLEDFIARLTSRKFIAFFMVVLVIAADNFGLQVEPELRKQLITMALAYMAIEGTGDVVRAYKQ